jgi:hypothetical protein
MPATFFATNRQQVVIQKLTRLIQGAEISDKEKGEKK